jgi:hypothetical protein
VPKSCWILGSTPCDLIEQINRSQQERVGVYRISHTMDLFISTTYISNTMWSCVCKINTGPKGEYHPGSMVLLWRRGGKELCLVPQCLFVSRTCHCRRGGKVCGPRSEWVWCVFWIETTIRFSWRRRLAGSGRLFRCFLVRWETAERDYPRWAPILVTCWNCVSDILLSLVSKFSICSRKTDCVLTKNLSLWMTKKEKFRNHDTIDATEADITRERNSFSYWGHQNENSKNSWREQPSRTTHLRPQSWFSDGGITQFSSQPMPWLLIFLRFAAQVIIWHLFEEFDIPSTVTVRNFNQKGCRGRYRVGTGGTRLIWNSMRNRCWNPDRYSSLY